MLLIKYFNDRINGRFLLLEETLYSLKEPLRAYKLATFLTSDNIYYGK